jgi:hypothetical protein
VKLESLSCHDDILGRQPWGLAWSLRPTAPFVGVTVIEIMPTPRRSV